MAAKTESTFINMVVVLFVVTAVAGLALGSVYNLTKEPIEIAKKAKLNKAIEAVLPALSANSSGSKWYRNVKFLCR